MKLTTDRNILIVGMGLIGGSYARALSKQGFTVRCITRSQSSVDYAVANGLIAEGTTEIDAEMIARSGLIVFALYPHVFVDWIRENGHLLKPGTYLTDVTGVKGAVVSKIQELLPYGVEFIAAHPMAGREVYGVENSDERIFRNANWASILKTASHRSMWIRPEAVRSSKILKPRPKKRTRSTWPPTRTARGKPSRGI